MTNILYTHIRVTSVSTTSPTAWGIGTGEWQNNTTEANSQITFRTAGTFSNMAVQVVSNATAVASSYVFRANTTTKNQTITIGIAATGNFLDSTNTDVVSAGDILNTLQTNGDAGAMSMGPHSIQFAPTTTTNTVNKLVTGLINSDSSVNTTYYNALAGRNGVNPNLNTIEANAQFTNKNTATLQNLVVVVTANMSSVATIKSRKNTANGNLSLSIGSGVTGQLEDTTHSDSVVSGDLVNTALNSTVTTIFSFQGLGIDYLTTNKTSHYLSAEPLTGKSASASVTTYIPISGDISGSATENTVKVKTNVAFTASNLEVYVSSNGNIGNSTFKFRKNNGNGNQIVTFGSGVTGYLEDTTNTDSVISTDGINYQSVSGSTGTAIVFNQAGINATYPTASIGLDTWLPKNPDKELPWRTTQGDIHFVHGTPGYTSNPRLEEYQPLLSPQPQKPVKPRDNYSLTMAYGLAPYTWVPKLSEQPQKLIPKYTEVEFTAKSPSSTIVGLDTWTPKQDVPQKIQKKDASDDDVFTSGTPGYTSNPRLEEYQPLLSPQPQKPVKPRDNYSLTMAYGLASYSWLPQLSSQPQPIKTQLPYSVLTHAYGLAPYTWVPQLSGQPQKEKTHYPETILTHTYGLANYDWPPQLSQQPQAVKTQRGDAYLTSAYGLANSGWYPQLSPQPQKEKIHYPELEFTHGTHYVFPTGWYPLLSPQPQKIILNSSISMVAFTNIEIIPPYVFIGRFF